MNQKQGMSALFKKGVTRARYHEWHPALHFTQAPVNMERARHDPKFDEENTVFFVSALEAKHQVFWLGIEQTIFQTMSVSALYLSKRGRM